VNTLNPISANSNIISSARIKSEVMVDDDSSLPLPLPLPPYAFSDANENPDAGASAGAGPDSNAFMAYKYVK
jgi:hypothetical protein